MEDSKKFIQDLLIKSCKEIEPTTPEEDLQQVVRKVCYETLKNAGYEDTIAQIKASELTQKYLTT